MWNFWGENNLCVALGDGILRCLLDIIRIFSGKDALYSEGNCNNTGINESKHLYKWNVIYHLWIFKQLVLACVLPHTWTWAKNC